MDQPRIGERPGEQRRDDDEARTSFAATSAPSRIGYVSRSSSVPRRRSSARSRIVRSGMARINARRMSIRRIDQKFSMMFRPNPNVMK
jgi:hypothetical protein